MIEPTFLVSRNLEAEEVCAVFDTDDDFTSYVQFFLAAFALGSLWIKRMREVPRRDFRTWFLDVSKMGIGAAYAHIANMAIAMFISANSRAEANLDDQCAWYAMNFLIDTTLGLALSLLLLHALEVVAVRKDWETLKDTGEYSEEGSWKTWRNQVLAWVGILTVVKIILTCFLWIFSPFFAEVGDILFSPMRSSPHFELIFVMILFPGVLNVLYFWVADSYLKKKPETDEGMELRRQDRGHDDDPMVLGAMGRESNAGLLGNGGVGGEEEEEEEVVLRGGDYDFKSIVPNMPEEPNWLKQGEKRRGKVAGGIEDFNL